MRNSPRDSLIENRELARLLVSKRGTKSLSSRKCIRQLRPCNFEPNVHTVIRISKFRAQKSMQTKLHNLVGLCRFSASGLFTHTCRPPLKVQRRASEEEEERGRRRGEEESGERVGEREGDLKRETEKRERKTRSAHK